MPYEFSIDNKESYIRVNVSGERIEGRELEDIISVWSAVTDKCREWSINKVLAVFQLTGRVPVMASYDIVDSAKEFGWSKRFRLALVDCNEASRQDNLFTETVAVNRFYPFLVVDNEPDAKGWLLSGRDTTRRH